MVGLRVGSSLTTTFAPVETSPELLTMVKVPTTLSLTEHTTTVTVKPLKQTCFFSSWTVNSTLDSFPHFSSGLSGSMALVLLSRRLKLVAGVAVSWHPHLTECPSGTEKSEWLQVASNGCG